MQSYLKNHIDFVLHSNGNNENNRQLTRDNTLNESFKLIYIYSGKGTVDIDGRCYPVEKDNSALVFPLSDFEIEGDGLKYAWLEFSGFESVAMVSRIAFSRANPILGKLGVDGMEDYFDLPETSAEPYALLRLGGCLMLLMSFYIEKYPSKSVEAEGYVYKACLFIDRNYSEHGFGVKDVVEELKIDRSYLYRLFKNEMGISVSDYIARRRLLKAEVLLTDSNLSVKDVAYSCGFADQMYFSRVFKNLNGSTPTQFREMIFCSK